MLVLGVYGGVFELGVVFKCRRGTRSASRSEGLGTFFQKSWWMLSRGFQTHGMLIPEQTTVWHVWVARIGMVDLERGG
jgi:hypothetical protein